MKAAIIKHFNLIPAVEEHSLPELKENEIRIRVHYSGLNFYELLLWKNLYPNNLVPPFVLGGECLGVITELGESVKDFTIGDKVLSLAQSAQNSTGTFAEEAQLDANHCLKVSKKNFNPEFLAGAMTYFTAYHILRKVEKLKGKKVLIHSASGGVGLALINILQSKEPGLKIIGTCSSLYKKMALTKRGLEAVLVESKDFQEHRSLDKNSVDYIFDANGADYFEANYKLLKPNLGELHSYGYYSSAIETPELCSKLRKKNVSLHGHLIWPPLENRSYTKSILGEYIKGFEEGKFKPQMDSIYTLEDLAKALNRMEKRQNIGKILIQCSSDS